MDKEKRKIVNKIIKEIEILGLKKGDIFINIGGGLGRVFIKGNVINNEFFSIVNILNKYIEIYSLKIEYNYNNNLEIIFYYEDFYNDVIGE